MNPRYSVLDSGKELITILTGLAIANAVLVFVTQGDFSLVRRDQIFDPTRLIPFTLLLLNTIRFYHGNMMHFEDLKRRATEHPIGSQSPSQFHRVPKSPWLDYFGITLQHVVFVLAGLYLEIPKVFVPLISVVLLIDLVMFAPRVYGHFRAPLDELVNLIKSVRWRQMLVT